MERAVSGSDPGLDRYLITAVSPLALRVAAAVYQNSPRVLCFSCLAAQQRLREHDLRAAALVLIVRAGLKVVRRTCSSCGRTDEGLACHKAA